MKAIKIIIERSRDAYWAYADNVEGLNGVGDTIQEAKQSVLECIDILREFDNPPAILQGEYELVFKFQFLFLLLLFHEKELYNFFRLSHKCNDCPLFSKAPIRSS